MRATWARCMKLSGPSEPYSPLARHADPSGALGRRHVGRRPSCAARAELGPASAGDSPTSLRARSPRGRVWPPAARMLREVVTALEALAEQRRSCVARRHAVGGPGDDRRPHQPWSAPRSCQAPAPRDHPAAGIGAGRHGTLRRAQADLLASAQTSEIRLQPLSLDEVERYLDLQLGRDARVSQRCGVVPSDATAIRCSWSRRSTIWCGRATSSERGDGRGMLEVSPPALEGAVPASVVGTVAHELEELAPDERQAIGAASVGRRRVLALAGRARREHRRARARAGPRNARPPPDGSSSAKASSSSPTASSVRSTGSRTGSTRKSCSTTLRRRPGWMPTRARGWRSERCSPGASTRRPRDLACHFHFAGDHLRAAHYLRIAAGNASSGMRRARPRRSCTAPSPTPRTWPRTSARAWRCR